jgi:hypothetical protein
MKQQDERALMWESVSVSAIKHSVEVLVLSESA